MDEEDGRRFVQVGQGLFLPLGNGESAHPLVGRGESRRHAEPGVGAQSAQQFGMHLAIAVGCLDEKLRLVLGPGPGFKALDGGRAPESMGR